jgi:cysteine desulfurase family protein
MIYLDNAATSRRKPQEVIDAVVFAMTSLGNAGRGTTEAALDAARTIYGAREKIAGFFGVKNPKQVVFTSNSTESLNTAIHGLIKPGDHVISSVMEHNSVLRPLYEREEAGAELTLIECDEKGRLLTGDIEKNIRDNTRAIVLTHGSNLTGNVNDIERVGRIAKAHGLLFIVDASQTAGVLPIDVEKMNIDVLCFTGHKSLLGPQGTGGMCVREGLEIEPLKRGGSGVDTYNHRHPSEMPTALEAGTLNGHGIAGLSAAIDFIEKTGIDEIREKEQSLMKRFVDGVRDIPGVKLYGDFDAEIRCPVVALNIGNADSSEISDILSMDYDIATRPGAHCAPEMHKSLGTVEQGAVRFSMSYFNTGEEIDSAICAVREISEELSEEN